MLLHQKNEKQLGLQIQIWRLRGYLGTHLPSTSFESPALCEILRLMSGPSQLGPGGADKHEPEDTPCRLVAG
jgi:hypothetical protein